MGKAVKRAAVLNHICIYILVLSLHHSEGIDILTKDNPILLGQTLVSSNQIFELGFFTPGNSSNTYLGIWFKNILPRKFIWVANKQNPLSNTLTNISLTIGNDGNLRILDGDQKTVWSTSIRVQSNETIAKLTGMGDFTLNDTISGLTLWESFDYPGNTLVPSMRLGTYQKTQVTQLLITSWKSDDDPTSGDFVLGLSREQPPQAFIWRGLNPYWRSGPWAGGRFVGIPEQERGNASQMTIMPANSQGGAYLTINLYSSSDIRWLHLRDDGVLELNHLDVVRNVWELSWEAPSNPCDVYGVCGVFSICTPNKSSICDCLKGFVPQSKDEWSKSNWARGCVRRNELLCEKSERSLGSGKIKADEFREIRGIKLPNHHRYFPNMDQYDCGIWCLANCSCKAYAFVEGIPCMVWTQDLVDIQNFTFGGENIFLRLAYDDESDGETKGAVVVISLTTIFGVLLVGGLVFCVYWRKTHKEGRKTRLNHFNVDDHQTALGDMLQGDELSKESFELPIYKFEHIIAATDNFSYRNKLGEGGFGAVYKGILDHGQEIAVKRLSGHSGQGIEEFKNEIMLISKLQHRNLVKLLGCCFEGKERILIYEYMINKSLDTFLFDPKRRKQLNWATRFNIIQGIGRGLIYLHRDSSLRIIHRDLKCSNILLDEKLNPKISDFGLARTFQMTQELANTRRIVGTYGYMSPEYAMRGVISEKSDVFSYGVMLLEIISGKRNTESRHHQQIYPLGHAWKSWKEGRGGELIDEALTESSCVSKGLRCIHVGLLCVQDLAEDRPTMTEAVSMLCNESDLPEPKVPLFTLQRSSSNGVGEDFKDMYSVNEVTLSMIQGR